MANSNDDSLFVDQPGEAEPHVRMAVAHMGNWEIRHQEPRSRRPLSPNTNSATINKGKGSIARIQGHGGAISARRTGGHPSLDDDNESEEPDDAPTPTPVAMTKSTTSKFTLSVERSSTDSSADLDSMSIATTDVSWRKWTAIHLTTLPSWCEHEYRKFHNKRQLQHEATCSEHDASRVLPQWPVVVFGLSDKINAWKEQAFYHAPDASQGPSVSVTGDSDWTEGAKRVKQFCAILEQLMMLPPAGGAHFVRTLQRHIVAVSRNGATGRHYLVARQSQPMFSVRRTLYVLNFPPFPGQSLNVSWRSIVCRMCAEIAEEPPEKEVLEQIGRDAMINLNNWATDNRERQAIIDLVCDCAVDRLFTDIPEIGPWQFGLADASDEELRQHLASWRAEVNDFLRMERNARFPIFRDLSSSLGRNAAQISTGAAAGSDQTYEKTAGDDEKLLADKEDRDRKTREKKQKKAAQKKRQTKRAKERKRDETAKALAAETVQELLEDSSRRTSKEDDSKAPYVEQPALNQSTRPLQNVVQSTSGDDESPAEHSPVEDDAETAGGHVPQSSVDVASAPHPATLPVAEASPEVIDHSTAELCEERQASDVCNEDASANAIDAEHGISPPCEEDRNSGRSTSERQDYASFLEVTHDGTLQNHKVEEEGITGPVHDNLFKQDAQSVPGTTTTKAARQAENPGREVENATQTMGFEHGDAHGPSSEQVSLETNAGGQTGQHAPQQDGSENDESTSVFEGKKKESVTVDGVAASVSSELGNDDSGSENVVFTHASQLDEEGPALEHSQKAVTAPSANADGVPHQDAAPSSPDAGRAKTSNFVVDRPTLSDCGPDEADKRMSVIDAEPVLQPAKAIPKRQKVALIKLPPVAAVALPNHYLLHRMIRRNRGLPSPEQTYKVVSFDVCGQPETQPDREEVQEERVKDKVADKVAELQLQSDVLPGPHGMSQEFETRNLEISECEINAQLIFEEPVPGHVEDEALGSDAASPEPSSLVTSYHFPVVKKPGQQRSHSISGVEMHHSPVFGDVDTDVKALVAPRTLPPTFRVRELGHGNHQQIPVPCSFAWEHQSRPSQDCASTNHHSQPLERFSDSAEPYAFHQPRVVNINERFVDPATLHVGDSRANARGPPMRHAPHPPYEWHRFGATSKGVAGPVFQPWIWPFMTPRQGYWHKETAAPQQPPVDREQTFGNLNFADVHHGRDEHRHAAMYHERQFPEDQGFQPPHHPFTRPPHTFRHHSVTSGDLDSFGQHAIGRHQEAEPAPSSSGGFRGQAYHPGSGPSFPNPLFQAPFGNGTATVWQPPPTLQREFAVQPPAVQPVVQPLQLAGGFEDHWVAGHELSPILSGAESSATQTPSRDKNGLLRTSVLDPSVNEFVPGSAAKPRQLTPDAEFEKAETSSVDTWIASETASHQTKTEDLGERRDSLDATHMLGLRARPSHTHSDVPLSSSDDTVEFVELTSGGVLPGPIRTRQMQQRGQQRQQQSTIDDLAARHPRLNRSPFRRPQPLPEAEEPARALRIHPLGFGRAPLGDVSLEAFLACWWLAVGISAYHAGQA